MCQQSVSWKHREGGGWHTMQEGWLQEALDSWERWVGTGGEGAVTSLWSQPASILMPPWLRTSPTATQQRSPD